MQRVLRIVVTGGPGAGKTTAADLLRRELGERIVVVPEAATMLFGGGFPRRGEASARRAAQCAIYHVQRNVEDVQFAAYPGRILLCDRGTVDGAAYWPDGADGFFKTLGTTREVELARYDAVIFFESAATAGRHVEGGNPVRVESIEEAASLDRALFGLWSDHKRFFFVPNERSFFKKITLGLAAMESIISQLSR